MFTVEHTCLCERGEGRVRPLDVELVAGRTVEGVRGVRPDLGRDPELGKEGERTPRGGG